MYIYIQSRSTGKEAAILRCHISMGAQNMDLFWGFEILWCVPFTLKVRIQGYELRTLHL